MRRVAVLLLSAVGFIPGCGLTQSLWLGVTEKPSGVESVRLSPDGSVCILYGVKSEGHGSGGLGPIGPHFLEVEIDPHMVLFEARRGIVLPAAHMDSVLTRTFGGRSVTMGEEELADFVRPRSPASRSDFDPASIPGYGNDWVQVPVSPGASPTLHSRGALPSFPYTRRARGQGTVGTGGAETITVRLSLPERSGFTPASCAWRALLTPLALVADAAADVVLLPVVEIGAILGM